MKIRWGVRPFAKMTCGEKGAIDPTILHLRAIKFVTNAVVIGRGGEQVFSILKREISSNSRERHWFSISLRQFVGSAKIIFTGFIFRDAEQGITKHSGRASNDREMFTVL